MTRYLTVLALAVVVSLVVLVAGRRWQPSAAHDAAPSAAPSVSLDLVIGAGGIEPALSRVPKDHRVLLTIRNERHVLAGVSLQGYQDRLTIGQIAPDSTWRGEFLADRPGEDFAWMIEGEPLGRLQVSGSHLIEGHR